MNIRLLPAKHVALFIFSFLGIQTMHAQLNFTAVNHSTTKLDFQNTLNESPQINVLTYQYFHNGGGVCMGDINNDGLPDLYFTGNLVPNTLYLNKGNLEFENISSVSKVDGERGWATGACMVDINNDGYLDIYVCKSGNAPTEMRKNRLYVNNKDLTFTERSAEYGLDDPANSSQAYFFDYDTDGDLDMYLLNHATSPGGNMPAETDLNTLPRDPNAGDKLYRNDQGKYTDVSDQAGIKGSPISFGLSASIGDMNEDGYPDIYVCNDYLERDYLYINQQNGTFIDELTSRTGHISNFSMGSDIADINNDGALDIMVADMAAEDNFRSKTNMSGMNPERFWRYVDNGFHYQYMINTLQLNNGDAEFSEISQLAGVDKTDWSWAPLFADFNQDGRKDLFVTNGLRKEARNNDFVKKKKKIIAKMNRFPDSTNYYLKQILDQMPEEKITNYLYENKGNLNFRKEGNTGMEIPTFSNGAAYGDLDGDGDLDLVVNNIDDHPTVYRNDTKNGNYLAIQLVGNEQNRTGIGARVALKSGDVIQTAEHYLARGYLSSTNNQLHFGIGENATIDLVEVTWFDGTMNRLTNVKANQTITITYIPTENELDGVWGEPLVVKKQTIETSHMQLPFTHTENTFDDFEREVLLPHKMSTHGPALAVGDVNGDGLDDFYVGGATGQSGGIYLQTKEHTFEPSQSELWEAFADREEVTALFFDVDGDNDLDLYVGMGGNEYLNGDTRLQDILYENKNGVFSITALLPESTAMATGCISPEDYDGDGDMDLFIGNRQTPGKYPFASRSLLLENVGNAFVEVNENSVFSNLGMVTHAIWEDVNGDDQLELIVSGEWMPMTILGQEDGKFVDKTEEYGLVESRGWWFGLAAGDIDGDGDIDLVGGNLGLNYKYHASEDGPFQIYSEDINEDGKNDIVLGYYENGKEFPLRGKQCSSQQIPEISSDFPTYDLFASATLKEVYGEKLSTALNLSISDFSSCVFLNEGGHFRRVNFSHDLQRFNWNGVVLRDINGDEKLDIVAAGNLYEAEVETPRCDGGKGLILLGNGDGTFDETTPTSKNWGAHNVKQLEFIEVDGSSAILIGNNNAPLELLLLEK